MRKTYCDRCGKEIEQPQKLHFEKDIISDELGMKCKGLTTIELCDFCSSEVMRFATTKQIEDTSDSVEVDVPGKPDETVEIAACCYGCGNRFEAMNGWGGFSCEVNVAFSKPVPTHGRECPWWVPKQEGGF